MPDVLLVEDTESDARLIEATLDESAEWRFRVRRVDRMDRALEALEDSVFDAALLDLDLPDSRELQGLERLRRAAPRLPVIVLTGAFADDLASAALKLGAQDYVVKRHLAEYGDELLARAIRYAIERQRLLNALDELREREREQSELARLGELDEGGTTGVTAGAYGGQALAESLPETFGLLVDRYGDLVDLAASGRGVAMAASFESRIHELVHELGFLRCGPQDVVALHTTALRARIESAPRERHAPLFNEGRMLLLKVMGRLLAHYRLRAFGSELQASAARGARQEERQQ